ncbi:hypothetical protein LUCX_331 [Xanthomonas phage vB_XciM_LucasX]|nr:hypothetical protein LUCX_331 [Xanthomonas phage vB_XciM_LucasX]
MSILSRLVTRYRDWQAQRREAHWNHDIDMHLKTHDNPFDPTGIELAVTHLKAVKLTAVPMAKRRRLPIAAFSSNIDEFLVKVQYCTRLIENRESIPQSFLPNTKKLYRLDDFFVTGEGHMVAIEKIAPTLITRLEQFVAAIRQHEILQLEENEKMKDLSGYYQRKLFPLYQDCYYIVQAVHATTFR